MSEQPSTLQRVPSGRLSSSAMSRAGPDPVKLDQFTQLKSAHERNRSLVKDDEWYAVSFLWWKQWEAIPDEAPLSAQKIGPVDNSQLFDASFGCIRVDACELASTYIDEVFAGERAEVSSAVGRPLDFIVVHESVWRLLKGWYGASHDLSAAVAIDSGEASYDFFPARFEVSYGGQQGFEGKLERMTISKYQTMKDLKESLSRLLELKDYEFKYFLKSPQESEWKRGECSFTMLVDSLPQIGQDVWKLRVDKLDFSRKIPVQNPFDREYPKVGQRLDVRRKDLTWCEGKIVRLLTIQGALKVVVHCHSFDFGDDEIHDIHSEALQPPYTRVEEWRSKLKVGSDIEVRIRRSVGGKDKRQWRKATVTSIFMADAQEEQKEEEEKCANDSAQEVPQKKAFICIQLKKNGVSSPRNEFKVGLQSGSIAPPGTHIKDKFGPQNLLKASGEEEDHNGVVGFINVGNTCYMNSMLQCMASVTPLVEYFLGKWPYKKSHSYKVNRSNPLGTGGKLAVAYGMLLKDIWRGHYQEIAPSKLKKEMGRTFVSFKGTNQHDAHEFFSLFVDRLHEDLNMIREKPLTDTVESNGRPDAVVAQESWENFQLRNSSVIVDVLMGMIKSTLTCPSCEQEATKFDPYSSLSLPIPTQGKHVLHLVVHRLGGKATRYLLDANKAKDGAEVAEWMSQSLKLPKNNVLIAELSLNRLNKLYYVPDKLNAPLRVRKTREQELFAYELDPVEPDAERSPGKADGIAFIEVQFKIPNDNNKHFLFRATEVLRVSAGSSPDEIREVLWQHVQWMFKKRLSKMLKPSDLYGVYEVGGAPATFKLSTQRSNVLIMKLKPAGLQRLRQSIRKDPPRTYYNAKMEDRNRALNLGRIPTIKASKSKAGRSGVDLTKCLEEFQQEETLGKNETWYCAKCKDHVRAQKKLDVWNTPEVLCIHLKRFHGTGRHRAKLDTLVNFPLKGLNLSEFVLDESSRGRLYDLFAVSNHMGSLNHGHYTAAVKRGDEWFLTNDRSTQKIKPEQVCTEAAYILFYKKRDKK